MGKSLLKVFDGLCDFSSLVILYVTVVVIFVQVIARYVLKVSLPWTEEFARFTFIWLIFLANAMAERQKEHFRVSYFVEQAPRKVRYVFWYLGEALIFVFFCWLLYDCMTFVKMGAQQIAPVMQLRMDYIYWGLPVAVILTLMNRTRNFIVTIRERPENPFT
ncbi:MAG: TRAP transporter small permease [candidate division NC10 bacterium]|nr:TRAP transporter small permease [candidate division NC10 bacterium]